MTKTGKCWHQQWETRHQLDYQGRKAQTSSEQAPKTTKLQPQDADDGRQAQRSINELKLSAHVNVDVDVNIIISVNVNVFV